VKQGGPGVRSASAKPGSSSGSATAKPAGGEGAPGARAARVAIVEDNPLVAKFFRLALERAGGFEVEAFQDVAALLDRIAAGEISLLLLDITLPHLRWKGRPLDGVELARLARRHCRAHLPIVVATAHAMMGDRERILEASGADDLMEKPIYDAAELVARLRRLLPMAAVSD
jgi:two-component system, cell cycle response regulator DivK